MMKKNLQKNNGYTLLFAVLVSSIVLSIGISILTISKKEFLLSASARDSTSAFYAADSALECAAYQDAQGVFATSSTPGPFQCAGATITRAGGLTDTDYYTFTFQMPLGTSGSCSVVTVEKYFDADNIFTTKILAKGYNIGWLGEEDGGCVDASSRRVERALQLIY